MTDNEKLARWQGHYVTPAGYIMNDGQLGYPMPDYPNDDAAAMSLLDTLVEKDYSVSMSTHGPDWQIGIARSDCDLDYCFGACKPTRREAIISACLEVARKEDV